MERQSKKQKKGNFRYQCPLCDEPAMHPVTLPIVGYICRKMGEYVTADQVRTAKMLKSIYLDK